MEALKRKWNSRRGASILLALLFLLICMMAGASVIMAAASNAGKIRSNKEEQQKYLTLTSALTLLCDELESVRYWGHYRIVKTTETNDDPNIPPDVTYTCIQQDGELQFLESSGKLDVNDWTGEFDGVNSVNLQDILPLNKNWDYIFAEKFGSGEETEGDGDSDDGTDQEFNGEQPADSYELTIQAEDSADAVNITVTVSGREEADMIILRASLEGYPMKVKATLVPTGDGPSDLVLPSNPERFTYTASEEPGDSSVKVEYYNNGTTRPVTWKLLEIVKDYESEELADEENP